MVHTDLIADPLLSQRVRNTFGADSDPLQAVVDRAGALFPGRDVIVWEGDAQTFQFSYVSESAERLLGYPVSRWTSEPAFWAEVVVHPEDRQDAIAFCALATGRCKDHDFTYRAIAADGRIVVLHDVVRVVVGRLGVAARLRGIMIDVTERPAFAGAAADLSKTGADSHATNNG